MKRERSTSKDEGLVPFQFARSGTLSYVCTHWLALSGLPLFCFSHPPHDRGMARRIGLRRPEHARAVLNTAVPPLLGHLHQRSSSSTGDAGEGSVAAAAERACSALVELSEIPGVFATAVSALLAGEYIL